MDQANDFQPSEIDSEIWAIYEEKKELIRATAERGEAETCLRLINRFLGFMNRFRNCVLGKYFDEDLHDIIESLNPRRFDTSHLLVPKKEFKIAFVFNRFNDVGGAAFTHRYILEKYPDDGVRFRQYILVSNDNNASNFEDSERYQYMRDNIAFDEFCFVEPGDSIVEKGEFIQQWLYDREIDFAVYQPSPVTLYALAAKPTLLSATFSADWQTFTLGPGTGDFTFLVFTDPVYKYRYRKSDMDRHIKTVMLPIPPQKYIDAQEPFSRSDLGLPEDAVVSATTNMWKCCFGDDEILLTGIATLMRRFPNYHHLFLGTERARDSLEFFISKNQDIKDRVHFLGSVPHIYKLLKCIDFYINSYPVSGATNTEAAMVGKPSVDLFANRDLSGHGTEIQRSHECQAVSLDEFVQLASRFVGDPDYRDDLGAYLKEKIGRDLDKTRIAKEKIYDTFVDEFRHRLENGQRLPALHLDDTIAYEKRIALYNAHGREHWALDRRRDRLKAWTLEFPSRPFAWIKSLEEAILAEDPDWFAETVERLGGDLLSDHRIHVMLALGHDLFGDEERALDHARRAVSLAIYDEIPARVAARLLVKRGRLAEAAVACPAPRGEGSQAVDEANVVDIIAGPPMDRLPLYYNY